jgi:CheY-like chemotaxis protein
MTRLVVIDDDATYRERYPERLNPCGITIKVLEPPTEPNAQAIVELRPDAVLVDYQLQEGTLSAGFASYKGSTLAAVIREKLPAIPIVLVSRRSLLQQGKLAQIGDVKSAFDDLVFKEDIFGSPRKFCADLKILVRGFRILRECHRRDLAALRRAIGARRRETDLLLAADPPSELVTAQSWRVTAAARWIRSTLLAYPGVLYDPMYASASLGISKKSFLRKTVQRYFTEAKYTGAFAPREGRWWKNRLFLKAHRLFGSEDLIGGPLQRFGDAWKARKGEALSRAVCTSSGESPANAVCFVLKKPVMLEQSLPYRPDARPAVMDEARLSFRAIKERNDYDELYVAPEARRRLREILHS